jgi:hypothetical protein
LRFGPTLFSLRLSAFARALFFSLRREAAKKTIALRLCASLFLISQSRKDLRKAGAKKSHTILAALRPAHRKQDAKS